MPQQRGSQERAWHPYQDRRHCGAGSRVPGRHGKAGSRLPDRQGRTRAAEEGQSWEEKPPSRAEEDAGRGDEKTEEEETEGPEQAEEGEEKEEEKERPVQVKKASRDQGARKVQYLCTCRGATTRQAPRPASLRSQHSPRGAIMRPAPRPAWQNPNSGHRLKRARVRKRLPDHQKRQGTNRKASWAGSGNRMQATEHA